MTMIATTLLTSPDLTNRDSHDNPASHLHGDDYADAIDRSLASVGEQGVWTDVEAAPVNGTITLRAA